MPAAALFWYTIRSDQIRSRHAIIVGLARIVIGGDSVFSKPNQRMTSTELYRVDTWE